MKNNFFVFIEIVFALGILFLCGIGAFLWFAIDAFGEDVGISIFLTLMLAILPTILFIWSICTFASKIFLDENGITKRLFGLKLKFFQWDEIEFVKLNGNSEFVLSVTFYKHKKDKAFSLSKYEKIYFCCNEKKLSIVNAYAPEKIKTQLNNRKDR